jgi:hypothetical protein
VSIIDFVKLHRTALINTQASVMVEGLLFTVKRSWHDAMIPYFEVTLGVLRSNGYTEFIPVRVYPPLLREFQDTLPALAYSGTKVRITGFPYSGSPQGHRKTWIFSWVVLAQTFEILDPSTSEALDELPAPTIVTSSATVADLTDVFE